ncbi:CMP/dCMP kinase [Anaerolineae bacterium]|nr:CMP/dCMP kinase [Anaerolineae bacterium]
MSPPELRRGVVTIDGPAASGKSSTAEWVARELGFTHVDSGAFYRAVTAAVLRTGMPPGEWTPQLVLEAARIVSAALAGASMVPHLVGDPADAEIRNPQVTANVPRVARMPAVRAWVNAQVRQVATERPIVVDGRDMGTAVFPEADVKVYLVADPWERAKRRLMQHLRRLPTDAEIAAETDRLVHRDAADATQSVAARDAVLIDTTHLMQEEQVARIVALARAALGPA